MKFHLISIFALVTVVLIGSVNASPPAAELYWKSVLPSTPIPKSVQLLLHPAGAANKSNNSDMDQSDIECTSRGYGVCNVPPLRYSNGRGEIGELEKEVSWNWTVFFLYDDLHPEKTIRLPFPKSTNNVRFLPRQIAELTPFSGDKLPAILKKFSLKPKSVQAKILKNTIQECEAPKDKGEDKFCSTSLESMVDFAISKLGNKAQVRSNEFDETEIKGKDYIISTGIKKMGDEPVVCHKQRYVYAVFYCHMFSSTKAYMVPLTAVDGTKAKGLVICHTDTSDWNPEHLAFRLLKVKPGPTICHFLDNDALVWFSD